MNRTTSRLVAGLMVAVFAVGVAFSTVLAVPNRSFDGVADHASLWLAFTAFMVMGALIVANRPGNAVGWIFSAIGLLSATGSLAQEYAEYAYVTRPGALPFAVLPAWYATWWWWPTIILTLVFTVLLFPTGRLPSPRWRPLAWTTGIATASVTVLAALNPTLNVQDAGVANPIGVAAVGDVEQSAVGGVLFAVILACLAGAVLSLILRFRRSRGEERQQLKWFTSAGALVALMPLSEQLSGIVLPSFLFGLVIALLPIAAGIAVLRYRLYDIDRIISRTLAWTLITGLLVGVYVAGVVVLGAFLRPVVGESNLAVAGATLLAAAMFGPLRRRVQHAVDRRFNRSRYDAQRTVEAFRVRLRDRVDLDELSADLLATVGATVEPSQASVWLRASETRR